jgi:hypothetical protein
VTSTPEQEGERAGEPGRRELAAAVSGIRQPIVIVLLLIAFFSAISGKPLDGLLMLLVAAGLAWDARHRHAPAGTAAQATPPQAAARSVSLPPGREGPGPGHESTGRISGIALLVAGALYAAIAGSFARFSWPATIAVVGVGTAVVIIGWHGPARARPDPGRLPRLGTALWGGVLVIGATWELWSLSRQPSLDVTSWSHPTVSALTDPLLASHPGRSLMLGVWLLLGWYLVRR